MWVKTAMSESPLKSLGPWLRYLCEEMIQAGRTTDQVSARTQERLVPQLWKSSRQWKRHWGLQPGIPPHEVRGDDGERLICYSCASTAAVSQDFRGSCGQRRGSKEQSWLPWARGQAQRWHLWMARPDSYDFRMMWTHLQARHLYPETHHLRELKTARECLAI